MLALSHDVRLAEPMADVFAALVRALARGRWRIVAELAEHGALPRAGFQYSSRTNGRLRRGEVIECLRPVSLIVHETLQKPPSCVRVRHRWRVHPLPGATRLACDLEAKLNRVAQLNRRGWAARLDRDMRRIIDAVQEDLREQRPDAAPGVSRRASADGGPQGTRRRLLNGKPVLR